MKGDQECPVQPFPPHHFMAVFTEHIIQFDDAGLDLNKNNLFRSFKNVSKFFKSRNHVTAPPLIPREPRQGSGTRDDGVWSYDEFFFPDTDEKRSLTGFFRIRRVTPHESGIVIHHRLQVTGGWQVTPYGSGILIQHRGDLRNDNGSFRFRPKRQGMKIIMVLVIHDPIRSFWGQIMLDLYLFIFYIYIFRIVLQTRIVCSTPRGTARRLRLFYLSYKDNINKILNYHIHFLVRHFNNTSQFV